MADQPFNPLEDTDVPIRTSPGATPAVLGEGTELRGRFRYRLRSKLGRGQFGSVYLATCLDGEIAPDAPPAEVAVKVFFAPPGRDPTGVLKRELSALLALRCDRIPRVYDWSLEGGVAFVVLEYYPLGSLGDWLALRGPLDPASGLRLLGDLLEALSAAHRASILHLDVKPKNVLCDARGGYVLTDFGISQGSLVSRAIVSTGLGAPGYQAPEQRRGDHDAFDARTDLWGVGVTVWTALTGRRLWEHPELMQQGPEHVHGLPLLGTVRAGVPPELERLVASLLAIDPERRPGGASEVLAQVRRLQAGDALDAEIVVRPSDDEVRRLLEGLVDPLWAAVAAEPGFDRHLRAYQPGDMLCREGEESYTAFVLLSGRVRVERGDRLLAVESREGTFLGEVAALSGHARTATLRAEDRVWVGVFNAAELERLVTRSPALGIRLLRSLADRLAQR